MAIRNLPREASRVRDLVTSLLPAAITAGAIAYALMSTLSAQVSVPAAGEEAAVASVIAVAGRTPAAAEDPALSTTTERLTVYIVGTPAEADELREAAATIAPPGEAFAFVVVGSREEAQTLKTVLLATHTPRSNDSSPVHVVILGALARRHTS